MHAFVNSPLNIGSLTIPHRLIQGPLAGFSCAPFRTQFLEFTPPAYCVSEMCSAIDVLHKHETNSRYLYRAPQERLLAYQISGTDPEVMLQAALKLEGLGADLIDINCGCPKTKIRKKGAGSALLETPELLINIIKTIKSKLSVPLTVKIRIQNNEHDLHLAQQIEMAGADALIVHGRRWTEDYDVPCNFQQMALIKKAIKIPVIANGDIADITSINRAFEESHCDAFMIGRAGTGRPWLYQTLLSQQSITIPIQKRIELFVSHIRQLTLLEDEYKAVQQGRSLVKYYFKPELPPSFLQNYYLIDSIESIPDFLCDALIF